MFFTQPDILVTPLIDPLFHQHDLSVSIARLDRVHPQVSGNKWFKLKYNLLAAQHQDADCVVSFGGPYSNHIHALAWAGKQLGLATVGIIRGDVVDNATLADVQAWGMQLVFVDRQTYKQRYNPAYQAQLVQQFRGIVIPEGGTNALAIKGVAEMTPALWRGQSPPDFICTAVGTGGTIAGIICGAHPASHIEGFPVLKGGGFLQQDIQEHLANTTTRVSWSLDQYAHYGGYGKVNHAHQQTWRTLEQRFSIPLDPVYTAKMLRRFIERVQEGAYPAGSRILLLHTGGLQGARSFSLSS